VGACSKKVVEENKGIGQSLCIYNRVSYHVNKHDLGEQFEICTVLTVFFVSGLEDN
jgi:hypothetical protein